MNGDFTPVRATMASMEQQQQQPQPITYSPMAQQQLSYSPMAQHHQQQQMLMGAVGPMECPCPTCLYYKSYYAMYHPEAMHMHPYAAAANGGAYSPMVDQFTPYQPVYSPNPRYMHANNSNGRQSSNGSSHFQSQQNTATQQQQPQHNDWAEEFARAKGTIVKTCCSASGRSMLQAVLKHQTEVPAAVDAMLAEILPDLEAVALDQHGCHVLRSLLEKVNPAQLTSIMNAMNETLVLNMCTLSQYTRRILQTLFERHQHLDLQTIVDLISKNVQYLSATQQGCISLMRIFEQCTAPQKFQIIGPLLPLFSDLATDQFGNYVVQCVIEHSEKAVAAKYVLDHLHGSMLKMSCNKYASNVMEKIVLLLNVPAVRRILLDELVFNPAALQQVVHDGFGNFVIQSIIESCSNPNEFKKICDRLRPAMANSPYAHRIDAKIRSKKQLQQAGKPSTAALMAAVPQGPARSTVHAY